MEVPGDHLVHVPDARYRYPAESRRGLLAAAATMAGEVHYSIAAAQARQAAGATAPEVQVEGERHEDEACQRTGRM